VLGSKYMSVYLVVSAEQEGDDPRRESQLVSLMRFIEKYVAAVSRKQAFFAHLAPTVWSTREVFAAIKREELLRRVELAEVSFVIRVGPSDQNAQLKEWAHSYLKFLGIGSSLAEPTPLSGFLSLIVDHYDLTEDASLHSLLADNAKRAACFRIDLLFDSYFNMPIRPQQDYNYFEAD